MLRQIILSSLIYFYFVGTAYADPSDDLVDLSSIPGLSQFINYPAQIYSGYLYINDNKSHHYIFAESQNSTSSDPLVLWLNGGPGCSSLLGFLYEHGPFIFQDGQSTLMSNQYAWNTYANVIYIETPACVGFSYCNDTTMSFNDTSAAEDNLAALLAWFNKFPEFVTNEFFIAGEGYAGVYIPYLVNYIDQWNAQNQSNKTKINLVGFAVGNPITNLAFDAYSDLQFWSTHAAVPPNVTTIINKQCSPANYSTQTCTQLYQDLHTMLYDINIYDFYRYCYGNSSSHELDYFQAFKGLYNKHYGFYNKYEPDTNRPRCVDDVGAYIFLNDQAVREGFHIWSNVSSTWHMCTNVSYTPGENASYFLYPSLIQKGYRILVYSGDTDGLVPTVGTIGWIEQLQKDLNMALVQPHTPWTLPGLNANETQIAGFSRKYSGLEFATIMGVGHMAPQWQPAAAFKMINSFLNNTSLN